MTEIISQGSQPNAFYVGPTSEEVYRAGDSWLDTGVRAELGTWRHIAITRTESGEGIFYLDGSIVARNPNYITATGAWNTRLGAQFGEWAGEQYAGCMDELRIWNYARDSDQIKKGISKGSITSESGLLYWNFDSDEITHVAPGIGYSKEVTYKFFGTVRSVHVTAEGFQSDNLPRERPRLIHYGLCKDETSTTCIAEVNLYGKDGVKIRAIPVNPIIGFHSFAYLQSDTVQIHRWRTPGVTHEDGTSTIDVNVFRFPLGADYCWGLNSCSNDVDEIVIQIYGSMRGPGKKVTFPQLNIDRACGDTQLRVECSRPWGLNHDYRYEVILRTEPSFELSHANGEARDGSFTTLSTTSQSAELKFVGYPVDFSYVVQSPFRPASTEDRADVTYAYIGVYAHSIKSGQSQWLQRCDYGRGLSLWYSGVLQSMPNWLPEERALTIQISSTHLRDDGSKNLGTFNIEMPIKTAQCLWGVDLSKEATAIVSTTYPGLAEAEVVTTSSTVRNGVYRISAGGFHFSSPTIKVRVRQDSPSDQTKSPIVRPGSPSVASNPAKKSLFCKKGTKEIRFNRKKCPEGFQKVSTKP